MTSLYLIRHGIAIERHEGLADEARYLTEKGEQKTRKVAQRLLDLDIRFEIILTSPLVRAYQTAEILRQVGLSKTVERFADLAPGGDLQNWVNWWLKSGYNKDGSSLALVGHQPDLGNWSEMLVWGSQTGKLLVKKAGVVGIILPTNETPIGNSELFLLTSPQWLL